VTRRQGSPAPASSTGVLWPGFKAAYKVEAIEPACGLSARMMPWTSLSSYAPTQGPCCCLEYDRAHVLCTSVARQNAQHGTAQHSMGHMTAQAQHGQDKTAQVLPAPARMLLGHETVCSFRVPRTYLAAMRRRAVRVALRRLMVGSVRSRSRGCAGHRARSRGLRSKTVLCGTGLSARDGQGLKRPCALPCSV